MLRKHRIAQVRPNLSVTGPTTFRVFSLQNLHLRMCRCALHLQSCDAQCNTVKLRIWLLFVVGPDLVKGVQWSRNYEYNRERTHWSLPWKRPIRRVARSSMFKSSTFCPNQYIFAVLAANGKKSLLPPFEFFCLTTGQVHFIQCLSSTLLL